MRRHDSGRTPRILVPALALVLSVAIAGCGAGSGAGSGAGNGQTSGPQAAGGTGAIAGTSDAASKIPAGREISEGGGGPVQYTFRETWRRSLSTAQEWHEGAYLITVVGDMVNDEGVPSSWRLTFADTVSPGVLLVDMDSWGKVTERREVTGVEAANLVGKYVVPIPFDVIDSDAAVSAGTKALAARRDLAKTKDPRIALRHSSVDGSGPYWDYTRFDTSAAEYVTARLMARTGEPVLVEDY